MTTSPSRADLTTLLQALPRGVRYEISEDCLRLWWRNWGIRKEYQTAIVLAIGWLIFTPLTIGITVVGLMRIREHPLGLICCSPILLLFGAGVLAITNSFLALLRSEGVAVYHDRIELLLSGFFDGRLKVREAVPFEKIARIGYGWYALDPDEPETVPTLNLFLKGSWWAPRRRMLAYWMKGRDKEVLFHLLDTVVPRPGPVRV